MESKTKGKVKWFNKEKGYGFINEENDSTDIFVHFTQIQAKGYKELLQGDEVTFIKFETKNGFQAKEVFVTKTSDKPKNNIIKKVAN